MKKLDSSIDLDDEVSALAEYIALKWTPIVSITELFRDVRDIAVHDARAWFDKHQFGEFVSKMERDKQAFLVATLPTIAEQKTAPYYDQVCQLLNAISSATWKFADDGLNVDGRWDFERRSKSAYNQVLNKYPDLAGALPLGWAALDAGYSDHDGMESYQQKADEALFRGVDVAGTVSLNFVGSAALPYVMYDQKCQGRKAPFVLVSAAYSHFLLISKFQNTQSLCKAVSELGLPSQAEVIFDLDVTTQHPQLKALLERCKFPRYSREHYANTVASHAAFLQKSTAEQEAIKAANDELMLKEVEDMLIEERVASLPQLQHLAGTAYTLWQCATKAMQAASESGDVAGVNWRMVENVTLAISVVQNKQSVNAALSALHRYSPGCTTQPQRDALSDRAPKVIELVKQVAQATGLVDGSKNLPEANVSRPSMGS